MAHKDPSERAEYFKQYRLDNLSAARERQRKWQAANREKHNARVTAWNQDNIDKYLLRTARTRAAKFDILFDLDVSDVVVPEVCPVLKTPFEYGTAFAATLDRIDPSKGYVKGNVMVMSKRANAMKSDASIDELKRFAEWILNT